MAYGNPSWFAGKGTRFDDWTNGHMLRDIGITASCLIDLDNDGDLDVVSSDFLINDDGVFNRKINNPLNAATLFFGRARRFTIQSALLTPGDNFSELIIGQQDGTIFGVCVGSYEWTSHRWPKPIKCVIDSSRGKRSSLILFKTPSPKLVEFLTENKIDFKTIELPKKYRVMDAAYLFEDVNSDGEKELVLWARYGGERKNNNDYGETASRVCVLKPVNGRFKPLSSFSTGVFKAGWYSGYYSNPKFKFADFDMDGKIDYIGDDGWIYRQTADFKFKKAFHVVLRSNSVDAIHLYACDVNSDGYPDVVSSYQPFTNIKFGPIPFGPHLPSH